MRRDRLAVFILVPLVFMILATLHSARSWAQEYDEGILNAVAYRTIPDGQPMRVVPIDNSDQNIALTAEFERQLTASGHTIHEDATLILTFETRDEIGAYKSRDRRAFVEMHARGGREGGEDAKMFFNLYDSNSGGVFNTGKGETSIITQSQYRMDVTIDDKSNGKRLWQAWAIADLGRSDGRTLTKSMVPVLVKNVGSTVKRQTFSLQ